MPFIWDTSWPGFLYCLKNIQSSLTNNMQELYIIDQSWHVRRWHLCRSIIVWHQSTARAIRKHKEPSALLSIALANVIQRSVCTVQTAKPGYFRQYRNPGKDTSCKNGPYGHLISNWSQWMGLNKKRTILPLFLVQPLWKRSTIIVSIYIENN